MKQLNSGDRVSPSEVGAPYVAFAVKYRTFLKKKKMTPAEVWRAVCDEWEKHGQRRPSHTIFYMAMYGVRKLPDEVGKFLEERFGFEYEFEDLFPMTNLDGVALKKNAIRMNRQKELFR